MTKYKIRKDEIAKKLLFGEVIRKTVSPNCNYVTEYYLGSDRLHANSVVAALTKLNDGVKIPLSFRVADSSYDCNISYDHKHKSLLSTRVRK